MKLNYTPIQQQQLLQQSYTDTQKLPLLLYAPDSAPALEASLSRQLHCNFFRGSDPRDAQRLNCAGVVVIAEDGALMSTALMQLASALADGCDFAAPDAVCGPEGDIYCAGGKGIALAILSKDLFLRVARPGATGRQILDEACALSQSFRRIPYALVRLPGIPEKSDLFAFGRKRALLLSHEYSMTGAPIVLVSMVPALQRLGYDVTVLGPRWDNAAPLFAQAGASVLVCDRGLNESALHALALSCDLVVANTVVEAPAVEKLSGARVPVLWWLHDAFFGYPFIEDRIPQTLGANVKVCAVGHHAAAAMGVIRPQFAIDQLLYGLPDLTLEERSQRRFTKEGRLLFISVGSLDHRKGQDILADAISRLSPEELQRAYFLFVGRSLDEQMRQSVQALLHAQPESVGYIPQLSREEIKALMDQCDCVVCSSRDDPMPTFVTEGAMFGKPAIVSEHTGTAALIRHGENGFVYGGDDPNALARLLSQAIREPEALAAMAPACRKLYEEHFTQAVFHARVEEILQGL